MGHQVLPQSKDIVRFLVDTIWLYNHAWGKEGPLYLFMESLSLSVRKPWTELETYFIRPLYCHLQCPIARCMAIPKRL